jgi:xylose isomerase
MINDGSYEEFLNKRYENWSQNKELMQSSSLESIYEKVKSKDINPEPQSGRQEYLENLLNSFIE